jgi:hypothetical protein
MNNKIGRHILLGISSVFPAFPYFPGDNSTYRGHKLYRYRAGDVRKLGISLFKLAIGHV